MLNDRGEQTENTQGNEAGTKDQCTMRQIEPCMQASPLKVSIELPDPEPKSDQRERGPDPRHQRAFRRLAIAFPGEFVGNIGGDRLVAHRRCPWLARGSRSL